MKKRALSDVLYDAIQRCELSAMEVTAVMAAVEWVSKIEPEEASKSGLGSRWPAYCKQLMEREES